MKRAVAAVILLVAVLAGCVWSYATERAQFERLLTWADTAEACYRRGDTDGARHAAESLAACYEEGLPLMTLFLPHAALTEAEKSVCALPLLLAGGEERDFLPEVCRCRLLLRRLWEQEQPTLQTVL